MSVSVPNDKFVDYYALLEVASDAGLQQIRMNYIRLAKSHHPDIGGTTDYMQLLNNAYKTLAGSLSRAAYDRLYELHYGVSAGPQFDEQGNLDSSGKNMPDDYVDYFLDKLYAEFHHEPKQKSFKIKLKRIFKH
jgi:curved DNA-binding protein CbpA